LTIQEDELLKAAVHGILLGATLPVLLYNMKCKNWMNIITYSSLIALETYHIVEHLKES